MKLLDLFCGAGGASVGYHRAAFTVTGVDIEPHPDYPYEILVADATALDPAFLRGFDVVHASPPCQRWTTGSHAAARASHPDLLTPIRELLLAAGVPYIIENVPTAPLRAPVRLCGTAFNLAVRRHRHFESTHRLYGTLCAHHRQPNGPLGVFGHLDYVVNRKRPGGGSRGLRAPGPVVGGTAMGIDWMSDWADLTEAIPPAYTHYLGTQMARHLKEAP